MLIREAAFCTLIKRRLKAIPHTRGQGADASRRPRGRGRRRARAAVRVIGPCPIKRLKRNLRSSPAAPQVRGALLPFRRVLCQWTRILAYKGETIYCKISSNWIYYDHDEPAGGASRRAMEKSGIDLLVFTVMIYEK